MDRVVCGVILSPLIIIASRLFKELTRFRPCSIPITNTAVAIASAFDVLSAIIVFAMPNTHEMLNKFHVGINTYKHKFNPPRFKILEINYSKINILVISTIIIIGLLFLHSIQKSEFLYFDF